MNKITAKKDEVLSILVANRDKHRSLFLRAREKFRERAIEEFDRRLDDAKNGRPIDIAIRLPVPEDHSEDYNRAIRMIELSVDDTIVLEEQDVAFYIQDDWAWKRAWVTTNTAYAVQ